MSVGPRPPAIDARYVAELKDFGNRLADWAEIPGAKATSIGSFWLVEGERSLRPEGLVPVAHVHRLKGNGGKNKKKTTVNDEAEEENGNALEEEEKIQGLPAEELLDLEADQLDDEEELRPRTSMRAFGNRSRRSKGTGKSQSPLWMKRNERAAQLLEDWSTLGGGGRVEKIVVLACGEGALERRLYQLTKQLDVSRILSVDVDGSMVDEAFDAISRECCRQKSTAIFGGERRHSLTFELYKGDITEMDSRFRRADACFCVETVEHMSLETARRFLLAVLDYWRPRFFLVTTPNRSHNRLYDWLAPGELRSDDHRWEMTVAEWREFCRSVHAESREPGRYVLAFDGVGEQEDDPEAGPASQIALFVVRNEDDRTEVEKDAEEDESEVDNGETYVRKHAFAEPVDPRSLLFYANVAAFGRRLRKLDEMVRKGEESAEDHEEPTSFGRDRSRQPAIGPPPWRLAGYELTAELPRWTRPLAMELDVRLTQLRFAFDVREHHSGGVQIESRERLRTLLTATDERLANLDPDWLT